MFKLFNTLTKKKEYFKSIYEGEARIYHCGPTVYDRAHIGNLRAYVFADTLRRALEYHHYKVTQVINITDVGHLSGDNNDDTDTGEDKMTKALRRDGLPMTLEAMRDVGTKYFETFKEDLKLLNILEPQHFPRASNYVNDNIKLIKILESKGFVYKTDDGLYFDTAKFQKYGKLGTKNIIKNKKSKGKNTEKSRIGENTQKHNHSDFALWKFNEKIGWESPWGKGFPGWHIECSTMSEKLLGQPFDIHTGGQEHVAIHHNNEIAQSEAAYGSVLAKYWMHNAWLTFEGGKMAKSQGNVLNLQELKDQMIAPLAYRYWLLTAKYRKPIDFSIEAMRASQNALIRLLSLISDWPDGGKINKKYQKEFIKYIDDDLDTPKAIALIWKIVKDKVLTDADKKSTILDMDKVLGLNLANTPKVEQAVIPTEIKALAEMRHLARLAKDWKKADALRLEIESRGFTIKDVEGNFEIKAK